LPPASRTGQTLPPPAAGLAAHDVLTRKLAALCEGRRKAVNKRTGLGQEIKAQLKGSFPFALELLEGDCQSLLAADFLFKWPDLASLQHTGAATIRRFFHARNYRRMDRIEPLLAKLNSTKPLTTDEAVIIPSALVLRTLAAQLRALLPFLTEYDKVLRSTFDQHPDADLFRSVPGAGEVMAPRLLTAFGTDRARFVNAEAVSTFSGIAPVTKSAAKASPIACATPVRSSCARAFTSSQPLPYLTVPGPRPFTTASVLATRAITPPFAPSPTKGSASSMSAGNHEPHTTNLFISNPSKIASLQLPNACE
jgi:hypothetical protein